MNPDQLEQVNEFIGALREHPYWAHTGLFIALITGVMLWATGRRVLKPAFAVIGGLLGGFLGHAIVPAVGFEELFGFRSDIVGALGGGMIGALAALLVFRLAIGVLASGVLAGLGILVASVLIQMNPAPTTEPADTEASPFVEVSPPSAESESGSETNALTEAFERGTQNPVDVAKDPGAFAGDLFRGLKAETWDPLTVQQRTLLVGGGFIGLLLGLGFSVFFPKKSTAMVTAFAGAGIWLPSVYFIAHTFEDVPGRVLLERTPVQWTAIWLVVSLTGLLIQTVGLKERKDKRDDRDDDWDEENRKRRKASKRRRRERDEDDEDEEDWD